MHVEIYTVTRTAANDFLGASCGHTCLVCCVSDLTYLSIVSVTHHVCVIASDGRLTLCKSPTELLQVLVARPDDADEVQLSTHLNNVTTSTILSD